MNKEIITNKQGVYIVILYVLGSAIVLSPGSEAKQDVWIVLLLALLIALPVIFLYARILSIFPEKDLFDILIEIFGKVFGKIIAILFIWYAFHLGAMVLRNFSEFIQVLSLPFTPQLIIVTFTGLICIWAVKAGIEVLGRLAGFLFPILIFTIICSIALSLTKADINNLRPILYNGIKPVMKSTFSVFSFPFAEIVVFMMAFCSIEGRFNTYKVFAIGLVGGAFILLAVYIRNIVVLGANTEDSLYFPSYSAVSLIEIGTFLQRIEILVSFVFLFVGIIKICVCLYVASNGVAKVFNLGSYRMVTVPIGFLMMNLSCFIYSSTMEMFEWASKIYPYYAIPFQVILPIITWILAEIKSKKCKQKNLN